MSATDRAIERFTELLIDKINNLSEDWKKPWFTPGAALPPQNLSGRHYNGGNSLMLMMQAEKMGYDIPVWGTFDRIAAMNFTKQKDGTRTPTVDANGQKLPMVTINKGERSFPVFLTTFTVVDKDTKERIPYDDYKKMDKDQRAQYNVYPKLQTFNVFNLAGQTNIKESRPELYEKLKSMSEGIAQHQEGDLTSHPAIDKMIDDNLYFCPIKQIRGDNAYYSISKDEIVVPERQQFVDGQAFATNVLHECSHAAGAENRLGRLKPGSSFGSAEYAKEELTAELSAAVIASQYGLTKHVKNDSAAYLKSWLDSLHENPDFLKTVLNDVKRCTSVVSQRIEAIQQEMQKGEQADYDQFKQKDIAPKELENEQVAAKQPSLSEEEVKTKLDTFMQSYYFAARRDNNFRMQGYEEYEGKTVLRLSNDASIGTSHYVVSHEQDAQQKDHFYMHLLDKGQEIFKSREMPHDRDDAYSFLRGAAREQVDYEYEKKLTAQEQEAPQEEQQFRRGR